MVLVGTTPRTREQTAALLAEDIVPKSYVNLGIGLPTLVANYIPAEREIIFHSENGILGMGPAPAPGETDPDLTNAEKVPITAVKGACYVDTSLSFGITRGGHLDYAVLGGFQVSGKGSLANWHIGNPKAIPSVGGAMDLVVGAKHVFVFMELFTKSDECKIVTECTYPLTGVHCVERVYTDYAVFDILPDRVEVSKLEGLPFEELRKRCPVPLSLRS